MRRTVLCVAVLLILGVLALCGCGSNSGGGAADGTEGAGTDEYWLPGGGDTSKEEPPAQDGTDTGAASEVSAEACTSITLTPVRTMGLEGYRDYYTRVGSWARFRFWTTPGYVYFVEVKPLSTTDNPDYYYPTVRNSCVTPWSANRWSKLPRGYSEISAFRAGVSGYSWQCVWGSAGTSGYCHYRIRVVNCGKM